MKRIYWIVLAVICNVMGIHAVDYCATASWGYAGNNVTGGGSATPTLVSNESELKDALKKSNRVIIITRNCTISNQISCDKSNLTIMALQGVRLVSTQQSKDVSGILGLKGSNIILRNLIFEGPGAFDCDGKDNLTLDGATDVWVDHCDFQDGCDGNFDIKGNSDNISVTWCRFRYLKAPRPRDAGDSNKDHTDDHRFSNLIGSSSTQKPEDGTYNITFAFCWWDEGCKQRMTRCRNCELHFLNCYWNSSVADYYVGPENAKCYFEGCTFAGKANSPSKIWSNSYSASSPSYCTFVNCTGNLPENSASPVAAPTYTYDHLDAATAKAYVIHTTCGAGATLTVTSNAEASSSCDSGEQGQGEEDNQDCKNAIVSSDCCINLSLGEEPTIANRGIIPSDFTCLSITTNMSKSTWEQGYLNLGGNADYITFDFSALNVAIVDVLFDVTIPNWEATKNTIAYHWNTNSNTTYTISGAAKEAVLLTAPANATSFTIQRSAGTGTRISQVCFTLQAAQTPEPIENLIPSAQEHSSAHKIIRGGQLLILRDNKAFNILGTRLY